MCVCVCVCVCVFPWKPEGSLGRTAQHVHLDSHTAPELCDQLRAVSQIFIAYVNRSSTGIHTSHQNFLHIGRDLNPRPVSHESGALTTELSPSPRCQAKVKGVNNSLRLFLGVGELPATPPRPARSTASLVRDCSVVQRAAYIAANRQYLGF